MISEDCKANKQCVATANKAMGKLRVIKRTFKYFNTKRFAVLDKIYIRPHLEYCIQAWSPSSKKDITILEKVQRRATKLIPAVRSKSYPERLAELNLYGLERRRLRGDLIEMFKILNGLEGIEKDQLFTRRHNQNRGHSYKLYKPALKRGLNCRTNFFSIRVINERNMLPAQVVETKSTNMFKKPASPTGAKRIWGRKGLKTYFIPHHTLSVS